MPTAGDITDPFVWTVADKDEIDKVVFGTDKFHLPPVTIVHVFLKAVKLAAWHHSLTFTQTLHILQGSSLKWYYRYKVYKSS